MATTRLGSVAREPRGMTLLEVLIAVTILAIVSVMIYGVFSASLESMRRTNRESEIVERARFTLDALETDLTNVHYRDETSYNTYMSSILKVFELERLAAEQSGDWATFNQRYNNPRADADDDSYVGNPYEKGMLIDLGFGVQDGSINFARSRPPELGGRFFPLGMSRVTYTLNGQNLIRREETVELPELTLEGDPKDSETSAAEELVANGVAKIEYQCAFWFDGQWYEVDKWSSADRRIRSALYTLAPRDNRARSRGGRGASQGGTTRSLAPVDMRNNAGAAGLNMSPGDPGWNEYINTLSSQPPDGLPSYVRVRLSLFTNPDKKDGGGTRTFQRIIRLPPAHETYLRDPSVESADADAERRARDELYKPVEPGAQMLEGVK